MKIIKVLLFVITSMALLFSGQVLSKQGRNRNSQQNQGSDSSLINSNKQSKTDNNVRGRSRAEERHDIYQSREPVNSRNNENSNRSGHESHHQ